MWRLKRRARGRATAASSTARSIKLIDDHQSSDSSSDQPGLQEKRTRRSSSRSNALGCDDKKPLKLSNDQPGLQEKRTRRSSSRTSGYGNALGCDDKKPLKLSNDQPGLQEKRTRRSSSRTSGYGNALGCDDKKPLKLSNDQPGLQEKRTRLSENKPLRSSNFNSSNGSSQLMISKRTNNILEAINSVDVLNQKPVFCVKWLGSPVSHTSWECLKDLKYSAQLEKFLQGKMQFLGPHIARITTELEAQVDEATFSRERKKVKVSILDTFEPLTLKVDLILLAQNSATNRRTLRELERIGRRALRRMILQRLYDERKQQLRTLKQFEEHMNSVEQQAPPIRVENNVDLDLIDGDFQYIQKSINGCGVPNPESHFNGCKCDYGCAASSRCCARRAGELFAYDKSLRRLRLQPGSAIYECNSRCVCYASCSNRLVQHGRKHELALFKTSNGSGWGVRTPHALRKGEFVCEYVGEIITTDEANERGKEYDNKGRIYLFDLDYDVTGESEFTIDSATYGNISHFVNHSCDPNMAVFPCWVEHRNPSLPRLAFFTLRNIKAGEELTIDYIRDNEHAPYKNLSAAARVKCRCGAANCRKVLF